MKVTLKILLAAAVVLLVYMCYKSVTGPIEYDDQKTIRDNAIIARLIEIRKAQIEYKNMDMMVTKVIEPVSYTHLTLPTT